MSGLGVSPAPEKPPIKRTPEKPDRATFPIFAVAFVVYFLISLSYAWTRPPVCDEAYYCAPGRALSQNGDMGSEMLKSPGIKKFTRIEENTYWTMPGSTLVQAVWYRLFGASLFTLRCISVLAGAVIILSWRYLFRQFFEIFVADAAAVLLIFEFSLLNVATVGRADALGFAFAAPALAVYWRFRESNLFLALAAGNLLIALAAMTHPLAGIAGGFGLVVLFFAGARQEFRPVHLTAIAVPYSIVCGLWLMYLLQDWEAFDAQFFENLRDRRKGSSGWGVITAEGKRYLEAFGFSPSMNPAHRVRLIQLLLVAGGFVVLVMRGFRDRFARIGVWLAAAWALSLFFIEGSRQGWYWVILSPVAAMSAAVAMDSLRERLGKWAAYLAAAAFIGASLVSVGGGIWLNQNKTRMAPLAQYLASNVKPGELIMGSGEIAFLVDFQNFIDDREFGRASDRKPDWIVFSTSDAKLLELDSAERYRYFRELVDTQFRIVHNQVPYVVYQRIRPASQ